MQTLDQMRAGPATARPCPAGPGTGWIGLLLCLVALALLAAACKKNVAAEAIDSDANGYLCVKCGAKVYTDRKVFIGPQCPKCQQETLKDVVAYECPKDHHLTMRPSGGPSQVPPCEQCQGSLANTMRLPHEKDLQAWGATKFSP